MDLGLYNHTLLQLGLKASWKRDDSGTSHEQRISCNCFPHRQPRVRRAHLTVCERMRCGPCCATFEAFVGALQCGGSCSTFQVQLTFSRESNGKYTCVFFWICFAIEGKRRWGTSKGGISVYIVMADGFKEESLFFEIITTLHGSRLVGSVTFVSFFKTGCIFLKTI